MTTPDLPPEPRMLVTSLERVGDFATRPTRNSGLAAELDRRGLLTGAVVPAMPAWRRNLIRLKYVHRTRPGWRGRASHSQEAFAAYTRSSGALIDATPGWDLVLMLQTLYAPSPDPSVPYAIYTDNTFPLTRDNMPEWAPLGRRAARRWLELEGDVLRGARAVFAMSEYARRSILEEYGCDPDRVVAVSAGANTLAPSLEGKRYDVPRVVFVGLNFELKGGEVLLEAWPAVRARVPDAELLIVGVDAPEGRTVPGVTWCGFVRDRERLAALYAGASVFVLPSFYDAYPHALREAMGQGLACVASDVGGVHENVTDGETGLLVPPKDAGALTEALVRVLGDPAEAERLGRAGHELVAREHTWGRVVDRMLGHLAASRG